MRFRLGLTVGFGAGYYLGARAGRDRYRQLKQWAGEIRRSDKVEAVADKAKAAVDHGVERAKEAVVDLRDHDEAKEADTAPDGFEVPTPPGAVGSVSPRPTGTS